MDTITINGVDYIPTPTKTGPEVIVRTYSAGVHVGTIKERDGKEVTLINARRIWQWQGAFTLNAVAMSGVKRSSSRISASVPTITLLEAIEIIPVAAGVDLSPTEA
jgi:hypothetical protein